MSCLVESTALALFQTKQTPCFLLSILKVRQCWGEVTFSAAL